MGGFGVDMGGGDLTIILPTYVHTKRVSLTELPNKTGLKLWRFRI